MKASKSLIALALLPLALTACGSSEQHTATPMESVTPIEDNSTPTKSGDTNDRGNIEASIGEEIVVNGGQDGSEIYKFKVTGIEPDVQCTAPYAQPAENGHLVKVDLEANTGTKEAFDKNYFSGLYLSGSAFKYIDNNGTTYGGMLGSAPAYSCLDQAEAFPSQLGPAQKASGSIIVDVPNLDGVIVYEDQPARTGVEYKIQQ